VSKALSGNVERGMPTPVKLPSYGEEILGEKSTNANSRINISQKTNLIILPGIFIFRGVCELIVVDRAIPN
jgi:hypothetical protein